MKLPTNLSKTQKKGIHQDGYIALLFLLVIIVVSAFIFLRNAKFGYVERKDQEKASQSALNEAKLLKEAIEGRIAPEDLQP
jgi:hypothetical protein